MTEARQTEKTPYASVQQTDGDVSPTPAYTHFQPRSRVDRLGKKNTIILILGTVAILLGVSFWAFLWYVSLTLYDKPNIPWLYRAIIAANWQYRLVTTVATVVRTAAAAQLACFAAILAALILERAGASAAHFPQLSVIRCTNSGPKSLVSHVWHNRSRRSQLGYSVLIIIAVLNATILQFTSTIIISDFSSSPILFNHNVTSPWGLSAGTSELLLKGNDYWSTGQISYPPIAELRGPSSNDSTSSDTGKTYRGFLPISNQTVRDSFGAYQGSMTVADERVVCVKPSISNMTFYSIGNEASSADFTLSGIIDVNNTHPDVVQGTGHNAFNCSAPAVGYPLGLWPVAICYLDKGVAQLKGGIVPEPTGVDANGNMETGNTTAWLFLNLTASQDFTYEDWQPVEAGGSSMSLNQLDSPKGPWSKFGQNNTSIGLSLCLFNPQTDVYEVEAEGFTMSWVEDGLVQLDSKTQTYNSDVLQYQLGLLTGERAKEVEEQPWREGIDNIAYRRGILVLDNSTDWAANKTATKYGVNPLSWMDKVLLKATPRDADQLVNNTFQLTPAGDAFNVVHKSYQAVAQGVFQNTMDPAVTLQTLTHMVLQTAYYDILPNFDLNGTTSLIYFEYCNIPVKYSRFVAVMCLLGLHFILITTAVVLFLSKTEMSLLGNAWHTVAQVHSPDTADAIYRAHAATDKELTEVDQSSGISEGRILIRRSERNGRHEAAVVSQY